jgi:hypothetical protein
MQITLGNCNVKLLVLGIDMNAIGSGALFTDQLTPILPNYESWEYDFEFDQLKIWVPDGTEIPDLSKFGEVLSIDSSMG